ncbi:MAG: Rap1a/Tai family immunity protein [Ruegeria sp.]
MKKLLFVLMAAFVQPQVADAGAITGNDLLEACSANGNPIMATACSFYAISALDNLKWGAFIANRNHLKSSVSAIEMDMMTRAELRYCDPTGVTHQQIVEIVRSYLEQNPETRDNSAANLIHLAFIEAFPCPDTAD